MILPTSILAVAKNITSNICRNLSNTVKKEFEVPTFCDVYIDVPYNIKIKPLNIHKYHNCDKLILEYDKGCSRNPEFNLNGNTVTITDKTGDFETNCKIKIPIKANLYVTCENDINVGQLHGDKINLRSVNGNITLDKFHGECVKVATNNGNIIFQNFIQASKIHAVITENGSINAGKIQGLNVMLQTNKGNVNVKSSYCDESFFKVEEGIMELANVHKDCNIYLKNGLLKLNGFDGKLSTTIENGIANIYLSRILDKSDITISNGSLNLTLSEYCQKHVKYIINAQKGNFADDLKHVQVDSSGCVLINPDVNNKHSVSLNCLNGTVNMNCASWQEMIQMKLKK